MDDPEEPAQNDTLQVPVDALDISTSSQQDLTSTGEGRELVQRKPCHRQDVFLCCCCGPLVPRWLGCCILLVVAYLALTPLLFLAIHFCVFPGNIEGDPHMANSEKIKFVAKYDSRTMQGLTVPFYSGAVPHQVAPFLFFGGNGQGMTGAINDAAVLFSNVVTENTSFAFQMYSAAYRGYSPNEGWVSEHAVTSDVEDLLDFVLNRSHGSNPGRVFLGGWSMGAGVAMQLAARRPESIAGLVVVSPWSTLQVEALTIMAPLTWLIWPWIWTLDVWDSVAAMASLPKDIPVVVMSASSDQVIRPWQHEQVYAAACPSGHCQHRWWMPTEGALHQSLPQEALHNVVGLSEFTAEAWSRVQVYGEEHGDISVLSSTAADKPYVFDVLNATRLGQQIASFFRSASDDDTSISV